MNEVVKNKSREADLNHRPKDINISYYSPPLYQLSYHGDTNFLYKYIFVCLIFYRRDL